VLWDSDTWTGAKAWVLAIVAIRMAENFMMVDLLKKVNVIEIEFVLRSLLLFFNFVRQGIDPIGSYTCVSRHKLKREQNMTSSPAS
jgi:hypothetical protein